MSQLLTSSATTLAKMIRARAVSPLEVVDAHIERIQSVNPRINALVAERFAQARAEAVAAERQVASTSEREKPLLGVPFTVKELIDVKGMPATVGTLRWRERIASAHALAVQRLLDAGAIPLGVTNLSELSFWMESGNLIYGRTNNPHDPTRIPGGSSGGEASLIAAGGSPFGLGTELGGSVRMPAFYCGVHGHLPSQGLIAGDGISAYLDKHPAAPGGLTNPYLTIGPMARCAEDLGLLLKVLSGKPRWDPDVAIDWRRRRVFVLSDPKIAGARRAAADVREQVTRAAARFQAAGAEVREFPEAFFKDAFELWINCISEAAGHLPLAYFLGGPEPLHGFRELLTYFGGKPRYSLPTILLCVCQQMGLLQPKKGRAAAYVQELRKSFEAIVGDGILLMPTQPDVAPRHNAPILRPADVGYTCLHNLLRIPATATRTGYAASGLPIGLQIAGRRGSDLSTIGAAAFLAHGV